jgi:predicted  nucleic acid-binding Zn-ribbon protein
LFGADFPVLIGVARRYNVGMSTFAESLDRLWVIQGHDKQILSAKQSSASSLRRVNDGQSRLKALQTQKANEEAALKQMHVREREIEQELKQLDKRITQIETVEGSEQAVEKHRAQIDEMETEGLSLLGSMTEQKERIQATTQKIAEHAQELEQQQRTSAEQQAATDENVKALLDKRNAIAADVPEEMMRVYNTLADKYPGNGLTTVSGDYCASCSGELTMNLVVRAKAREEFVRCPHCNRVLDPAKP